MSGDVLFPEQPSGLTVIKAVSLWEPWASLMRLGAKTIETRSWPTSYRGPLLVCAAKVRIPELPDLVSEWKETLRPLARPTDRTLGDLIERLGFGHALAVVDLIDCLPTAQVELRDEAPFGDYSPGRWAWVTKNLRVIQPFPIRGHQGLWNEAVQTSRLDALAGAS